MAMHKGAIKRVGARYGMTIRNKVAEAESMQKSFYDCPSCGQMKVKRISAGIWGCKKCGAKFAGGAYTVSKKVRIQEEIIKPGEQEAPKKRRRLTKKEPSSEEAQEEE